MLIDLLCSGSCCPHMDDYPSLQGLFSQAAFQHKVVLDPDHAFGCQQTWHSWCLLSCSLHWTLRYSWVVWGSLLEVRTERLEVHNFQSYSADMGSLQHASGSQMTDVGTVLTRFVGSCIEAVGEVSANSLGPAPSQMDSWWGEEFHQIVHLKGGVASGYLVQLLGTTAPTWTVLH